MDPIILQFAAVCFCVMLCSFVALRRAVHIFQLCSYQSPGYRDFLRRAPREVLGSRRVFPLIFLFVGLYVPNLWFLPLIAAALFLLCNRYPRVKKPLVYTHRVLRLLATAFVCTAVTLAFLWFLLRVVLGGLSVLTGALPLAWLGTALFVAFVLLVSAYTCAIVLAQPWLVMLYNAINQPIEQAGARRYKNEAKKILASMPNLRIIGLTGSYGKTSTKYFAHHLLSAQFSVYMTPGNFNTTLGVVRAIREGLRPVHELFLCEMGARHVGDIADICELVHPDMGVLSYIGTQHLETFGSQQAITDTKLELRDAVEGAGGTMFVNFSSPIAAEQRYAPAMVSYGTDPHCAWYAHDLRITQHGSAFALRAPDGQVYAFETRLLGRANVENLCGAIALAHTLGVTMPQLRAAAATLEPVPHRLQLIPGPGLSIIDDAYNANPQGAAVALETLGLCTGSKIVVTPGLVELGRAEEAENHTLGERAAAVCDYIVTVGGERTRAIRQGAVSAGFAHEKIFAARDLQQAMNHVRALQLPDKMVLLLTDLPDNYEPGRYPSYEPNPHRCLFRRPKRRTRGVGHHRHAGHRRPRPAKVHRRPPLPEQGQRPLHRPPLRRHCRVLRPCPSGTRGNARRACAPRRRGHAPASAAQKANKLAHRHRRRRPHLLPRRHRRRRRPARPARPPRAAVYRL